jgi:hypothetical protein
MKRQKLEASQSGLLDDESLDIRDILTSAVSRVPMVGGLLAEIVDPPEANAGASIIYGPEREENFRRWFGDSKVVDEEGKPLVVYHGTGADIKEFKKPDGKNTSHLLDLGYHFGAAEDANTYAEAAGRSDKYRSGLSRDMKQGSPVSYPAHLSLQNPADFRGKHNGGNLGAAKDVLLGLADRAGMGAKSKYVQLVETNPTELATVLQKKLGREVVRDALESAGYDGVRYKMYTMGSNKDSYLVFRPTQIKSIHNRGTYNPDDPDLLGMNTMNMSLLYG